MERRLFGVLLSVLILSTGCLTPAGTADRPAERATVAPDRADGDRGPIDTPALGPNVTVVSVEAAGDRVPPLESIRGVVESGMDATSASNRSYVVVPDAERPDAVLRIADEPLGCDSGDGRPARYCVAADGGSDPATALLSPGLTDDGLESATTAALSQIAGDGTAPSGSNLSEPAFATPWPARDSVTVTVENEVNPDRDFEPLVAEALRWWEAHDGEYGNYTTDWRLVDDPDADVTVAVVDAVERCGAHDDPGSLLGCAPVLDAGDHADAEERVRITGGYTDETTLRVLKHEFGHVYGRSHGDAPEDLMTASLTTTRLAEPNATERDFPWESATLSVHVDYDSFDAPRGQVRREVDRALAYYERDDGDSVARDVTFDRVRSADDADVTIRAVDDVDCLDGPGTCGQRRGYDTDADPALEVYSGLEITAQGVDAETLGWHTGRWLGYALIGSDSAEDLPPAFRDGDGDHRRDWHERGR